jgi:hypothetical protein
VCVCFWIGCCVTAGCVLCVCVWFVCCVTAGGLCVCVLFVCCVTTGRLCVCVSFVFCESWSFVCLCLVYWVDLRHSLMIHVFISSLYITVQRNCRVTSLYCVVFLNKLLR